VLNRDDVVLFGSGEIQFALHRIPWQSAEDILEPADELTHYLERCLGKSVPSAIGGEPDMHPVALVLHRDVRTSLEREAFELEVTPGRVELRARTVPAMYHAVYWFLETYLGVRWLWPGASGEVAPAVDELKIPVGTHREAPDYDWRAFSLGGALCKAMDYSTTLHAKLGLPKARIDEFELWCRRNRFGGLKVAGGHRWAEIAPPEVYGKTHPEYYALVGGTRDAAPGNGKHGNQPCFSHPGVAELTAEYARDRFEADPWLDVLSVAINDGGRPCECDLCQEFDRDVGVSSGAQKIDLETDEDPAGAMENRRITDQLFKNLQDSVKAAGDVLQSRYLMTHLYSYYRDVPAKYDLPKEVVGQYCINASTFGDRKQRDDEYERLRKMSAHVPTLGIYEYLIQGAWPDPHRLFPHLIAESVKTYHEIGARYYASQPSLGFATSGLNPYVLSRCLWNVNTDADEVIEDYCRSGFGAAAGTIRTFFDAFSDRWLETESGRTVIPPLDRYTGLWRLYPEDFLTARESELDRAASQVRGDDETESRIKFLTLGMRHLRLYWEACRKTSALLTEAKVEDQLALSTVEVGPAYRPAARDAVEAWDVYWAFVKEHTGTFVFADFWVNYRSGVQGKEDPVQREVRRLAGVEE
jgi:hypothetical protein